MKAVFNCFDILSTVSPINFTIEGCMPSDGSSNNMTLGSETKALAIANCCCCPPLNEFPELFLFSLRIGKIL